MAAKSNSTHTSSINAPVQNYGQEKQNQSVAKNSTYNKRFGSRENRGSREGPPELKVQAQNS